MTDFITFTRRTNDPKLSWVESQLSKAGIAHRRNGESFHAPILEIDATREDDAWRILTPVDDIPDDDKQFSDLTTYFVWFTLVEKIEAKDSDEAFDIAMGMLNGRNGMEISSHEVLTE